VASERTTVEMEHEVIGPWQVSSYTGANGDCFEFAPTRTGVALRHSHHPDGPVLQFTHREMWAMLQGAKDGEFDHLAAE
jgi:hypothetical protein